MAVPDDGTVPTQRRTVHSGTQGFGAQVALSSDGKTLVATDHLPGEDPRSGQTVFVTHDADGDWTEDPAKPEPAPVPLLTTGTTIAVSADGSRIAVGVWQEKRVHLFERQADKYVRGAELTAAHPSQQHDLFGASVALSGDGKTLAVGALEPPRGNPPMPRSGSIHVFALGPDGWSSRITPPPPKGLRGIGAVPLGTQLHLPNIALSRDGKSLAVGDVGERSSSYGYLGWALGRTDSGRSYGAVHLY
nr:FG-GAP repeat protein [Ramlibacter aurantiacus]